MSKKKILIVEDDGDTRTALCMMLEAFGYDTVAFSGSKEALAKAPSLAIDLALLDIMMPEMNGYELLKELKKLDTFAQVPIIMVTAKDEESEKLDGYNHGADYYLTKPFTAKQLEMCVKIFLVQG